MIATGNSYYAHTELIRLIDALCASARGECVLAEDTLRTLGGDIQSLSPKLTLLEAETLHEAMRHSGKAIANCSHHFSGHVLARLFFQIADVLVKKNHYPSICWMVHFSSDVMFDLMLNEKEYYYLIAYSFYAVCGGHARIENKGYFDVMRYVEKKRGYNGMDIDFIEMTFYYASAGLDCKQMPYENHNYCKTLTGLYHAYRSITDEIPERYERVADARVLYHRCMEKVKTESDGLCPFMFPGMAYQIALYLGDYKKRKKIAGLFDADNTCHPTDLDAERRRSGARRVVAVLALIGIAMYGYLKAYGLYNRNPLLFYAAAGFVVTYLLLMLYFIAPAVTGKDNPKIGFVYIINPWIWHRY